MKSQGIVPVAYSPLGSKYVISFLSEIQYIGKKHGVLKYLNHKDKNHT